MKHRWKPLIAISTLFLSGCLGGKTTTISFDGLQMNIPAEYTSVNSSQFDSYQIINKILKVYKLETTTLIVARSALAATLSPEEYATTSKEKLAQAIPGYEHIDDGTVRFDCGSESIEGKTHSFAINDSNTDNPGKTYVIQYYFIAQGTPYIISQADRTNTHYSDFTSIVNSLHCS